MCVCVLLCCVWLFATPWFLCPWNSPDKNTGVGSHFLLQGSSQPGSRTQVSHIADRFFFTVWAPTEAHALLHGISSSQELNPCLLGLLHCKWFFFFFLLSAQGSLSIYMCVYNRRHDAYWEEFSSFIHLSLLLENYFQDRGIYESDF